MIGRLWGAGGKTGEKMMVEKISIDLISPSPYQCRTNFNSQDLEELALSIKEHGIVQPLLLRKMGDGYQLIAGERRLRAAKMAGLNEVPAIIRAFSDEDVAMVGLIENLQRSDLHFLEEARGYERLLGQFNLTQQELADRIGKSQSTIANKLRLLKFSATTQEIILQKGISERHARALLALDSEDMQLSVIEEVANSGLTVKGTEKLIEAIKIGHDQAEDPRKSRQHMVKVFKDLRLFLNSMKFIVDELRSTGVDVEMEENDGGDHYEVRILIDKDHKGAKS